MKNRQHATNAIAGPEGVPPAAETGPLPLRRKYAQPDLRVLVFKMAGHEYVVDVALVQEIVQPTDLIHMDGVPGYIEGLIKRRGHVVPIVDLRKRLSLGVSPPTAETCAIVVRLSVGLVGFVVDSVSELRWVKTHDFEVPSPVIAGIDQFYLQGVAHLGHRLLVMLDLERLLTSDEQHELSQVDSTFETLFSGEVDAGAGEAAPADADPSPGSEHRLRNLVVFELGDELYGVPATEVIEVRAPLALMPLPNVPPHVLGLINLRGVVLPVLDLRRKFGLHLKPHGPDNRLIILKGPGYSVAVWVDRVLDLARLPRADFQPAPPGVARIDPEYYDQVTTLDGRILIELNVQKLLVNGATGAGGSGAEPAEGSQGT